MKREDLIRMGNDIAAFFASYPDEEAVAGVADHLKKFWEPRMRAQLLDIISDGAAEASPLLLKAAARLERPAQPA